MQSITNENIVYMFSIIFQITSGIILLFDTFSSNRKNIIRNYLAKGIVTYNPDKNELEYNEEDFKEIYCQVYLTKMAIIFFYYECYLINIWI